MFFKLNLVLKTNKRTPCHNLGMWPANSTLHWNVIDGDQFDEKNLLQLISEQMKEFEMSKNLTGNHLAMETAPVVSCMKTLMMVFNFIFWVSGRVLFSSTH